MSGTLTHARSFAPFASILCVLAFGGSALAGGIPPVVLDSAPRVGGGAIGCAFVEGPDILFVLDVSGGRAWLYDGALNHPPPMPFPAFVLSPGGANLMTGIAWNPNNNHLYWLDETADVLYETETNGMLLQTFTLGGPAIATSGDLCVDPVSNTLWIIDATAGLYREYSLTGVPTGSSFANPAAAPGTTPFGRGITYHPGTDEFVILFGPESAGQVTDMQAVTHTGSTFGALYDLAAYGPQIGGAEFRAAVGGGQPSVYVIDNGSDTIYRFQFPSLGCGPPTSIVCDTNCSTGDLECQWQSGGPYTSMQVRVLLAATGAVAFSMAIGGGATSITVPGLAAADYLVEVRGICPGSPAPQISTIPFTHTANLGLIDNIIVGPVSAVGLTDSAGTIAAYCGLVGKDFLMVPNLNAICTAELGLGDIVWVCLGTFPDNETLSQADGTRLVTLLLNGASVYCEGSDVWGFDPPTPFADYDGVDGIAASGTVINDGDDSCHQLTGRAYADLDLTFLDSMYLQDQVGDDSTDRLLPTGSSGLYPIDLMGPNAGVIIEETNEGYATAIYYIPEPTAGPLGGSSDKGKSVCTSNKAGGIKGDENTVLARIDQSLKTRTGDEPFRRGDCNDSGACNIADAIILLTFLFGGGGTLVCPDACDMNDDGVLNIADAIYKLTYLFSGGAAPPPPFSDCGTDGSTDLTVGCGYASCP
ncbi:MAG: hypothetical protein ACKVX7_14070 [Planctomycetota bacterium]